MGELAKATVGSQPSAKTLSSRIRPKGGRGTFRQSALPLSLTGMAPALTVPAFSQDNHGIDL